MSIDVGDFNGDSRLDIVSVKYEFRISYEKSQVYIWFGYGNGSFTELIMLPTNSYSFPTCVVTDDFNSDSYMDIVVVNQGNYNLGIFLGEGDGTFQKELTFSTKYFIPGSLVTGDFNGDAYLDLAYKDLESLNVGVLLGYGNGSFKMPVTFSFGDSELGLSLTANDLNNDERLDLILMGTNHIRILWNTSEYCASNFSNTSLYTSR
jgi:hypothetical protein